jgi:hypothetical protein
MDGQNPVRQRTLQARDVQKRLGVEYYEWRELKVAFTSKRDDKPLTNCSPNRHPRIHSAEKILTQSLGVNYRVNEDWSSASNSVQRTSTAE